MRASLLAEMQSRYVLADGAMGTELLRLGLPIGGCPELQNIDSPDQVLGVHRSYVEAGAECIKTNTFGANRIRLNEHGIGADHLTELIHSAVALARDAAGAERWVLGSVGPCAGRNTPPGTLAPDELKAVYAEQMAALAGAGVDALLLETQTDMQEVYAAMAARAQVAPAVPIFVTLAFAKGPGGVLQLPRSGEKLEAAIEALLALSPDGVGANCGAGVDVEDYPTVLAAFRARTDLPILTQPNAGHLAACGGKYECTHPPEVLVEGVWGLIRAGANLIGGCCGTTPEHIRLFREELDRL